MKLYCAKDSIALASHIALAESGANYEYDVIDHHAHICSDGTSYLSINPNGYVPALRLDNGQILTETIAVLVYIAENAPDRSRHDLLRADKRYEILQWTAFAATELHQRFMRFPQPGASKELIDATKKQLCNRYAYASANLEGKKFLTGGSLSIADVLLYTTARWLRLVDIDVKAWPALSAFMTMMEVRPALQRAFKEQGIA